MDDIEVIWEWHGGLLRRASFAFVAFIATGCMAVLLAIQPIIHQREEDQLKKLGELHRVLLDDFRSVATTELLLSSGGRESQTPDFIEPLKAQLRYPAQPLPAAIAECADRWYLDLSVLQNPMAGGHSVAKSGADEALPLDNLVRFRAGLTALQALSQRATEACAYKGTQPSAGPFCGYFLSIREKELAKYEQIAASYTAQRVRPSDVPSINLPNSVFSERCLSTPNVLVGYEVVAQYVDGASAVRTLGEFANLGDKISTQRVLLGQQAAGVVAAAPGGLLSMSLAQNTTYVILLLIATLSVIYGHYSLKRLSDLLKKIPADDLHAKYRFWPHFLPVFMSPIATVQFDPDKGVAIAWLAHRFFMLFDHLPMATWVFEALALGFLLVVSGASVDAFLAPWVLSLSTLLMLIQLAVLGDYLRERGEISQWIAARRQLAERPTPAVSDLKSSAPHQEQAP